VCVGFITTSWSVPRESFTPGRQVRLSKLRPPAVSILAVATVALGVGANAAIFSVVHRVPLPYPAADRVVIPWRHNAQMGGLSVSPSYTDLLKWRTADAVEALMMYSSKTKVIGANDERATCP
jgi:hypothetical protein